MLNLLTETPSGLNTSTAIRGNYSTSILPLMLSTRTSTKQKLLGKPRTRTAKQIVLEANVSIGDWQQRQRFWPGRGRIGSVVRRTVFRVTTNGGKGSHDEIEIAARFEDHRCFPTGQLTTLTSSSSSGGFVIARDKTSGIISQPHGANLAKKGNTFMS